MDSYGARVRVEGRDEFLSRLMRVQKEAAERRSRHYESGRHATVTDDRTDWKAEARRLCEVSGIRRDSFGQLTDRQFVLAFRKARRKDDKRSLAWARAGYASGAAPERGAPNSKARRNLMRARKHRAAKKALAEVKRSLGVE